MRRDVGGNRALMKKDDQKPQPKPAGAVPPPRPPRSSTIALGPDDDDAGKGKRKKGVLIKLPPKPSVGPPVKPIVKMPIILPKKKNP